MLASPNQMFLPLLLMTIMAPIGAIDLVYYHILKFKLHSRPDSYLETIVHLIRGLLFAGGAFILLYFRPQEIWFWLTGSIFLLDFINSIADVSIEGKSRKSLGGQPTLEYVIHTVGSTFAGAITAAYFILGWEFRLLPSALVPLPEDTYPVFFNANVIGMVVIGMILTFFEAILLFKTKLQLNRDSHEKKHSFSLHR